VRVGFGLLLARRALLETEANPHEGLDYLVALSAAVVLPGSPAVTLRLRYVPDRRLLTTESFNRYLGALAAEQAPTLEGLAATFLDDANNELVPRWVQVSASLAQDARPTHAVLLEDRQPHWDNPALLARQGEI
jgi:7-cyano-7-deazaguanine reductase